VAFAGLAVVILPMVMDGEPRQPAQEVQIRIPAQDERMPFAPMPEPPEEAVEPPPPVVPPPVAPPIEPPPPVAPPVEPPPPVAPPAAVRPVEKPVEKPAPKPPVERQTEAQRVEAILSGKTAEPARTDIQHVILIGAFSNPVNVRILQTKIGELGIRVYTEPLESPDGRKTRVRAGPFANRAAAERALEKMKRIGVNGVIATRP
jgi:DedD protein